MPQSSRVMVTLAACAVPIARKRMRAARIIRAHYMKVTLLALLLVCVARVSAAAPAFDVLIRNGHVMDGTGSPWYSADIGIRDGHIAAIGRLHDATAKTTIDPT